MENGVGAMLAEQSTDEFAGTWKCRIPVLLGHVQVFAAEEFAGGVVSGHVVLSRSCSMYQGQVFGTSYILAQLGQCLLSGSRHGQVQSLVQMPCFGTVRR